MTAYRNTEGGAGWPLRVESADEWPVSDLSIQLLVRRLTCLYI